ncbi:MAG: hypothetical protein AB1Z65_15025 [Candidatus Sulfomarinibacteraceae bacterium]
MRHLTFVVVVFCALVAAALPAAAGSHAERVGEVPDGPTVHPGLIDVPSPDGVALYSNGPFVNSPGTGVGGADESVLQNTSLGMDFLGFGHQFLNDNWVADDFIIDNLSGWNIESIWFYAYQTGSTTTSTITGVHVRIWDGVPGDPGSTVVWGDAVTNRLQNTFWSGAYRVTETTTGAATDRPVMVVEAAVNTILPPGTYWLDWQADGTLASGPWAPPITITGQATTGNGLQSLAGAVPYNPAEDPGSMTQQGFPFEIFGGNPPLSPVRTFAVPAPPGETPVGLDAVGTNLIVTEIADDELFSIDTADPTANVLFGPVSITATSQNPIGVTHDGITVYITDTSGGDVDLYDGLGVYISSFPVDAYTTFPEGIAFNPLSGTLFVVNGSGGNQVHEFSTGGTWIANYPLPGTSQDGIAWDYVRNCFWVYDSGTDTVRQFNPVFQPMATFPGTAAAGFGSGEGLAVIGDSLYVMATGSDLIVEFDISSASSAADYIFGDGFESGGITNWN